ncbi:proliferation marker protein Ki-67 isoform X3 [Scleropages formosus]|uniref:proliferation marker protein Ki-67 isoform X2 n=1 Tax=Scleropages formosus TaxID=113540 RepID=UPI0010FA7B3A|nr:proliferation marker protein Ki-67 isoform X2 [Scleropages formosus]XP_029104773.1 proliferation marker protein Ki-67 isoform X3 [Scleropages formosus]
MPLHGKLVVLKRSGRDGTELPLTATCVFGRAPECDIRIQVPEVSKEHCRIELNENKEVILTNLSLVNPTRINGKVIQQSKRLNHGDVITVIGRSFRFEYAPEPTPKKKREFTTVCETLQDQQLKDPPGPQESEQKEQSCLKDGTNTANLQSSKDQCIGDAENETFSPGLEQENPSEKECVSPFCELYQMIKQNFSTKSPWKPARGVQLKTLTSRRECQKSVQGEVDADECTPAPNEYLPKSATPKSIRQCGKLNTILTSENTGLSLSVDNMSASPARKKVEDASQQAVTPAQQTVKKGRHSCQSPAQQPKTPVILEDQPMTASQMKTPKRFSTEEVVQQILSQDTSAEVHNVSIEKSLDGTKTRRSKGANSESTPSQCAALTPVTQSGSPSPAHRFSSGSAQARGQNAESSSEVISGFSPKPKVTDSSLRTSPRTAGKKLSVSDVLCELESAAPSSGGKKGDKSSSGKKRKSGDLISELPQPKRKRVSFGGQLSPELFDKRLPPNSPLRKGATPGRRSLSMLKKQQSLLRRASAIGLIQEVHADRSGSKSPVCPEKKTFIKGVSSRSRTPSPVKKSSSSKAKTPSPSSQRSSKMKPEALPKNCEAERSPNHKSSSTTVKSSLQNRCLSSSEADFLSLEKKKSSLPVSQTSISVSSENVATQLQSRGTPCSRKSLGTEQKPSSKTTSPDRKSLSINDFLSGQTSTVRGRFSVSRIETPSPVADKSVAASESIASEVSGFVTPKVPLRRKSLKSSKKTPKSLQKSALEIFRRRKSGASRANLNVLSSWADIVKFGASKPQAGVVAKKQKTRGKAVKKAVILKPKTPAQKIKDHFSTGHAASPATIVVGKAHLRTVMPAGCAPKLVPNVVLLKNMKVNEDLTGVAEMFSTPVNLRQKTIEARVHHFPKTPQDVPGLTSAEVSVMKTPEETGEMLVSPLSVVNMAKQGSYNDEAVLRLFSDDQEFNFTCDDSVRRKSERLANANVHDSETNPVRYTKQVAVIGRKIKTPKLKHEAVMPLTGVKRLKTPKQKMQQVEDLRGIKMLLKTPKDPKMNEELSLIAVKKLLKTPKVKGQPVEDMIGIQRLMKTPKTKTPPLICTTGMKRLMCTPKPKSKPVEDLVGVKRLMRTPKQKNEPVEDMVGVKRLMQTPRQKNEPVEDMVGVKRLMQTPRQKNKPVEDMVGVKRLMRTPKQKGKPVESKFGIAKLMKSPRQKAAATVEDYTGLQELMQDPVEYYVKADMVSENPSLSDHGKVLTCADTAIISEQPVKLFKDVQSDDPKKIARRRPTETVDDIEGCSTAMSSDSVLPNVRPKRGTKVSHGHSSTLKVEVNKDRVASPAKPTRGRKAKPVEEFIKDEAARNLSQNMTNHLSKQCDEGDTSTQVLSPKSIAPVQAFVKGRCTRKAAVILENLSCSGPVRKIGSTLKVEVNQDRAASPAKLTRGRKAKPVEEFIKDEAARNLGQNMTNHLSKQCDEGDTSTQVLSPKSIAPVQAFVKGRCTRKAAVILENLSCSGPVRKIGSTLKVEVNQDRVASPAKLTRGRKAKPVEEFIKDEAARNLGQNMTNHLSKQCDEGDTSTQVLSPKSIAPVQAFVKGRCTRKAAVILENLSCSGPVRKIGSTLKVEVNQDRVASPAKLTRGRKAKPVEEFMKDQAARNLPSSGPVRKIGRGKMAKQSGEQKVILETIIKAECVEALPPSLPEVTEDQKHVNLSLGTKSNRGRKVKLDTKDGSSSEHSLEISIGQQKDANSDNVATELQLPTSVVKCRRGRLASTVVKNTEQPSLVEPPSKRTRHGAIDFTSQAAIPSVPSSRPEQASKVAKSLDVVEGTTCVQPETFVECETKSVKKTRGSRKTGKILDSRIVNIAVGTPSKGHETPLPLVDPSVSDDIAIEIPKKVNKKGKATSQSKSNKANRTSVEEAIDMNAEGGQDISKKAVTWSKEVHGETAEPLDVERQEAANHLLKTRRGRVVKKGNSQVREPPEPVSEDAARFEKAARPLRKSRVSNLKPSQPGTDIDVPAAKQGTRRKLASEEMSKELPLDAESFAESSKTSLTSKWTRRKAPNVEVKTEANTDKRSRASAKKAEKALEDVPTADVPQPVTRGRKRVGQHIIPLPEPESSERKSLDKEDSGITESTAKASNPETRRRGKSQTKPDAPSATEARPVRCRKRK